MTFNKLNMISHNLDINAIKREGDWTLFLDRDGVINRRLVGDYVKHPQEFEFLPEVLEAWAIFAKKFKYIFVVTNQQGIGKGLMTEVDLTVIHELLRAKVIANGGRIDAIYHCPDLAKSGSINRKPEIGMALQAQRDFPSVNFAKSIMIGDSISDMQFGKNAGMKTIFVGQSKDKSIAYIDAYIEHLMQFAAQL
jgi:histidinol-phosphate phosphatase family protein